MMSFFIWVLTFFFFFSSRRRHTRLTCDWSSDVCSSDLVNVPIRTVVFTALSKYDGQKVRLLKAREFHQIAGRAGRAGYDTVGNVVVQAPEHVIENEKALAKAGDDPKKRRKVGKKKPPEGSVGWGEPTFQRMVEAEPEALTSS